ncbi:glycoside hydrolase domain-containing protein [Pedobacter sp. N36a]|uniref:glycoside hydrolase domain-containing protein n=1 Tax=Pedobacter sp. N36a TaxID=2767996 RepID=UPI002101FC78|nr:glycoside hydrolase domain-containing protein [Pedobacter sp. N36a]
MALAPSDYHHFLAADFGWEDRFYLVGYANAEKDWPYAMPGPADEWGGTGNTSGIRSQVLNILFGLENVALKNKGTLIIDVLDYQGKLPPLVKVMVNGKASTTQLPVREHKEGSLKGDLTHAKSYKLAIPVENLRNGGNEIQLTSRLKKSDGSWFPDFDPFKSGANEDYVEGNAWQLTYFVPQDIPGLIKKIGKDRFTDRLSWGFGESYKLRFNAPGDQYWDYPVIQGNQQSMHFAYLFNWAEKPWLTQKWSRSILDRFYGYGPANAYLDDEDQGQMSAWFIMNAIGLFQTDGGAGVNPIYEIGSPIFSKVTIHLNELYGRGKSFTIEAAKASRA